MRTSHNVMIFNGTWTKNGSPLLAHPIPHITGTFEGSSHTIPGNHHVFDCTMASPHTFKAKDGESSGKKLEFTCIFFFWSFLVYLINLLLFPHAFENRATETQKLCDATPLVDPLRSLTVLVGRLRDWLLAPTGHGMPWPPV
jgi:hypothetical protein